MRKTKEKNRGITLIALVITIVLLLILSGIAIGTLSKTELFDSVKQAKNKTIEEQDKENKILSEYEEKIDFENKDENERPNGETITPLNDVNILLKCANKENKNYENINDIIEDEQLVSELVDNHNSYIYILRSKEFLKIIDKNNLLDDKAISIPNMTSNNSPSGEAQSSSSNECKPFHAFDKNINSGWRPAPGEEITDSYLQYEFPEEKYCYKIVVTFGYSRLDGKEFKYKFQGSNDGLNWEDISNELTHTNSETLTIYTDNEYIQKFKYFRFKGISGEKMHVAVTYSVKILELNFYCAS